MPNVKTHTGRIDSLQQAFKSLKEVFIRPDNGATVAELKVLEAKYPETNWKMGMSRLKTISEDVVFDTYPLITRENAIGSDNFTHTYTTCNGADMVPVCNGQVIGEIVGYDYDVNGEGQGVISLEVTRFMNTFMPHDHSLFIASYQNKYGHASYEVLVLDKLKRFMSGINVNDISSYYDLEYICRLVKPLTKVPSNIRYMNDDDFSDLVKEADSGVPATWLPDTVIMGEETKNTLLNRVIIWQAIEVAKLEKKAAKKDA